jgi:putative endonuclease
VYILESEKNGRFYIGSTSNIKNRLQDLNAGYTKSTKKLRPWKLVFQEGFNDEESYKIELGLKKLKNRDILKRIISDKHINMRP